MFVLSFVLLYYLLPGCELQESPVSASHLPTEVQGLQTCTSVSDFYMASGGLNSDRKSGFHRKHSTSLWGYRSAHMAVPCSATGTSLSISLSHLTFSCNPVDYLLTTLQIN